MKYISYRNLSVFLNFALLIIEIIDDENTKNSHLCTARAKFASNSNERRFSVD